MAQILDPTPEKSRTILCCYVNATSDIQVVRITNIINWYFERVVFPGQRLVFESMLDGVLEVHTGMMASAILSDTIPCERLCVNDDGDVNTNNGKESNLVTEDLPKKANNRVGFSATGFLEPALA